MGVFYHVYTILIMTTCVVFAWLSFVRPGPPTSLESNLPPQAVWSVMEMGTPRYGLWSTEASDLWESGSLVPANGGAVLATNLSSGFHFWARPAMFHHLRCLRDIRRQFISMSRSWDDQFSRDRGSGSEYDRLGRCFDYLRQVSIPAIFSMGKQRC